MKNSFCKKLKGEMSEMQISHLNSFFAFSKFIFLTFIFYVRENYHYHEFSGKNTGMGSMHSSRGSS